MVGTKISGINPIYPPEAKANRIQGAVVIEVVIGRDGTIQTINSVTGPELLQESALEAVHQWTYKPYILNGEPVEVQSTITVNYSLGASSPQLRQPERRNLPSSHQRGSAAPSPHPASSTRSNRNSPYRQERPRRAATSSIHLWVNEPRHALPASA